MEQKNDREQTEQPPPTEPAAVSTPSKRFRIEKVEERIAPKKDTNGSVSGSIVFTSSGTMSY